MAQPTQSKDDWEQDGADILPGDDKASLSIWPNADDEEIERTLSQQDPEADGKVDGARVSEKATSILSNGLRRTMTGRSTASWPDPGPPPDGGRVAWTQAVLLHLTTFNTFGYTTAFGVRASRSKLLARASLI